MSSRPGYVYVASSWRNPTQPAIVAGLREAGIDCYDFRNPPNGAGFGWEQVGGTPYADGIDPATYRQMLAHPRAVEGFDADFAAMDKADTFVLVGLGESLGVTGDGTVVRGVAAVDRG